LRLDNQVCFALYSASLAMTKLYKPLLDAIGLTYPQYLVMLALWEQAPRSLGELADELAMEPATLSPIVQRLQAQGLIARARRADDERVLEISLTPDGAAHRERALAVPEQIMARVGMDATQIAALRDALAPFAGRRSG
jgi:DNA-binding MarR family transcriptional regulator